MSDLPDLDLLTGFLPRGTHPASHEEIRRLLVLPKNTALDWGSPQREKLFAGYETLISVLHLIGIASEQWIGGSFVSRKENPSDIDLVNFCDVDAWDELSTEVRAMARQYFRGDHTAAHCHCDSYMVPTPCPNHQHSDDFQIISNYWANLLGHDEIGRPKGIIARLVNTEQPTVEETAMEQNNAVSA